jgi:hypothetical protein
MIGQEAYLHDFHSRSSTIIRHCRLLRARATLTRRSKRSIYAVAHRLDTAVRFARPTEDDGGRGRALALLFGTLKQNPVLERQLALLPRLRCPKGLKAELPTADPHTSATPTGP